MAIYKPDREDINRHPGSKALRQGRRSEPYACYSLTTNHVDRKPILADDEPAGIILESLNFLRGDDQIRLLAFCVMPDHLHFVAYLLQKKTLSEMMKSFGAYTARRLNEWFQTTGQFWQDGFHDHRCRDGEDIEEHVIYNEHNPVRAGLVYRAEDWLYSSASRVSLHVGFGLV